MVSPRPRVVVVLLSTVVALAAAVGVSVPPAGAASADPAAPVRNATATSTSVHYAVARPLCARPAAGAVRCMALRRVDVAKGTPGARSYVQRAGISYGPSGGYTPADLASAYHYNPRTARSNHLVAVVEWGHDPAALHDLNAFDRHYHLPSETTRSFRVVNGAGRSAPLPATDRTGATETALDVEAVRAVCQTCRIVLVEADRGTAFSLAAAENTAARLGATEITNSFGLPEPLHIPASLRNAYTHPGVVITVSSGDDGWYGWDRLNTGAPSDNAASFPATLPTVVAVGGTTLKLGSSGTRTSETVWNSNGPSDSRGGQRSAAGASGGGCSRVYAAPSWQATYPGYAAAGCKGKRLSTDVSVLADPMYGFDIYDSLGSHGWTTVGGTSLSSPIVAALYAVAGGSGGSSYPGATLYANGTYRHWAVSDVTSGGSGFCGGDDTNTCQQAAYDLSDGQTDNPNTFGAGLADCSFPSIGRSVATPALSAQCNAVPGFDGASGLGAPKDGRLFTSTAPALSIAHSSARARRSTAFAAGVRLRLPGTRITSYAWSFGDGNVSTGLTDTRPSHTYRAAGTYRVTLRAYDSRHQAALTTTTVSVR